MNIYDYFVSSDIAAYCENIGHVFNPLEMAVIIELSNKTIKEKHAAWQELITDYPDMTVKEYPWFDARGSLHGFLRELIAWEENWLTSFYTPGEGVVYRPYVIWRHHDHSDYMGCYSTCEKAWTKIREEYDDWVYDNITHARIYKDFIDDDNSCSIWLGSDGEPFNIDSNYVKEPDKPGELELIFIHIPVPFEKGDFVEFTGAPESGPSVLRNLPHWSPNYSDKVAGKMSDGSDMIAWVNYMDDEGQLSFNDSPCYLYKLKYFTGNLIGYDRFLKYLSDFVKKKEKSIDYLIHSFNKIRAITEYEKNTSLLDSGFRNWTHSIEEDAAREKTAP